jgi:hypothetical protein
MKKKKVTFTVKYTTEIEIKENEYLSDIISDILIPEPESSKTEYVPQSFEIQKIEDIPETPE